MLRLHTAQAAFGDCLLLEYGSGPGPSRFILIDGGPPDTFQYHLRPLLEGITQAGSQLDLVVLSHVDGDHVTGLLDYFAQLRLAQDGLPVPPRLWLNSFEATVDPQGVVAPQLATLLTPARASVMSASGAAVQSIEDGAGLRMQALAMQIPINDGFPNKLVTVDDAPNPVTFDGLKLTVVGPTKANLAALRKDWADWLASQGTGIMSNDPFVMANADRSVPNLSSIMFLADDGKRKILLTGDGRSDHLLEGLRKARLLDGSGKMHVDVLKLAHHGSDRDVTKAFFRKVTADTYVASANGKDGNPDLATLIWLVEAAKDGGRQVEIVVTNPTPSLGQLQEDYPAAEYGYTIRILQAGQHAITV